jgi:hypothetical protein
VIEVHIKPAERPCSTSYMNINESNIKTILLDKGDYIHEKCHRLASVAGSG